MTRVGKSAKDVNSATARYSPGRSRIDALPTAKSVLRRVLLTAGRAPVFWPLLRSRATVFMLHRFRVPDLGIEGHDPTKLRRTLSALRREGYELLSLSTLLDDLMERRRRARPAIAFTIDDGYFDHAAVAADVFAEFDCPVTTFVTTGFLDGDVWFWWDQIEYLFHQTKRAHISMTIDSEYVEYVCRDVVERRAAQLDFTDRCKRQSEAAKQAAIKALVRAAEVDLPAHPSQRYAPMTWTDLRACERKTMTFGPHTVTHPVLARTSDAQARFEIAESWRRLRSEAAQPVPIFCYPNGQSSDFGNREMQLLQELDFLAGVSGVVGYLDADRLHKRELERFRLRRFAYSESLPHVLSIVSGFERLKQIIRRED